MKATQKAVIAALTLAGGAMVWGSVAQASTISIGFQETGVNGGAITTAATSGSGTYVNDFTSGYGSFSNISISAYDSTILPSPEVLDSQSLNISSSTSGTLYIYVTSAGLLTPNGYGNLLSSFTTNKISAGWTVTESTYYDLSNGTFSLANAAGTATFTKSNSVGVGSVLIAGLTGPYSITQVYKIQSIGSGSSNDTIDTSFVPEPSGLGMLGLGLSAIGLLGWLRRRRVQKQSQV